MPISDQLRKAIRERGETHYHIYKQTGVATAVIDRFVSRERPNITAHTIDRLCDYLGLELSPKKPRKKRATKAKRGRKN